MAHAGLDDLISHTASKQMIRTVTNIADELENLIEADGDLTPTEIVEWLRIAARILEGEA